MEGKDSDGTGDTKTGIARRPGEVGLLGEERLALSKTPGHPVAIWALTRDLARVLSPGVPGTAQFAPVALAKLFNGASTCSKSCQLAAARKLTGKVKIANIGYSESFSNASSQEYRHFLELFFRTWSAVVTSQQGWNPQRFTHGGKDPAAFWNSPCGLAHSQLPVWGSLPAALRQHVDAGEVRMEVIGVTNGSVVVDFHLLIIADLDVREVASAFLTAFQTAPLLEVIGGDTFIQGREAGTVSLLEVVRGDTFIQGREAGTAPLLEVVRGDTFIQGREAGTVPLLEVVRGDTFIQGTGGWDGTCPMSPNEWQPLPCTSERCCVVALPPPELDEHVE
ncbi:hypothetical protein P7K49_032613 [Saguinus oedipus]|uniref:Uncharacterized protein n=1 Tax=Saguinus oedipus TaxID=9490 RepID=A0ABQ9U0M5_SAGOE|nr:hypothetical protein P7K49_032613 [Saguinus oedipus]